VCVLDAGQNCNWKNERRARLPCVGQLAGVDLAELSVHDYLEPLRALALCKHVYHSHFTSQSMAL
jgi:hypothetical protein